MNRLINILTVAGLAHLGQAVVRGMKAEGTASTADKIGHFLLMKDTPTVDAAAEAAVE